MACEPDAVQTELTRLIGGDCFGPVPEARIANAERELGATFPPSYRVFLRHFGAANVAGYQIHGLPDPPEADTIPFWLDLVEAVRMTRSGHHPMPHEFLYLTNNGGDTWYYLDTSRRDAASECPVVEFGSVAVQGAIVAESFLAFLRRLVEEDRRYRAEHPPEVPPRIEGFTFGLDW
jgi:hypothetical protein